MSRSQGAHFRGVRAVGTIKERSTKQNKINEKRRIVLCQLTYYSSEEDDNCPKFEPKTWKPWQCQNWIIMFVLRRLSTAKCAIQYIRTFTDIPVVDVAALVDTSASTKAKEHVGQQLHRACSEAGFFYIENHGVWHVMKDNLISYAINLDFPAAYSQMQVSKTTKFLESEMKQGPGFSFLCVPYQYILKKLVFRITIDWYLWGSTLVQRHLHCNVNELGLRIESERKEQCTLCMHAKWPCLTASSALQTMQS
jgi:hypothetical protein